MLRTSLAEPIKIATAYKITKKSYYEYSTTTSTNGSNPTYSSHVNGTTREYKNYFFGQEANAISDVKECSIVR